MAKKPDDLTIDYKKLLKLGVSERISFAQTADGQSYLASLTPAQLAALFPNYYKKQLPDLGRALSGGAPSGSAAPSGGAAPSGAPSGTATPAGGTQQPSTTRPAASPNAQKNSFLDHIRKISPQKETSSGFQLTEDTARKAAAVDAKGFVNKEDFYKQAVTTFRNSPLNGFVPKDGEKYGIKKGTPEEWANLAMRTAKVESSFKTTTTNPNDPGGSFGLFQFGYHYGINKNNWQDPQAQLDAFVDYSKRWVVNGGGYILPPRDVKDVRRYAGHGGFGAAFSTFRDDKVNSQAAWAEASGIESRIAARQAATGVPQQDPSKTGSAGITDLRPQDVSKDNSRQIVAQAAKGDRTIGTRVLDRALQLEGMHERRDRETIQKYLKNGGAGVNPATTRWCADFVNATLAQEGIKGTKSAVATSFSKWGVSIDDPNKVKSGDVLVEHRGRRPGEPGGHVGLATGQTRINKRTGQLEIEMYGGNQSDTANKKWVVAGKLHIRRSNEAIEEERTGIKPQVQKPETTKPNNYSDWPEGLRKHIEGMPPSEQQEIFEAHSKGINIIGAWNDWSKNNPSPTPQQQDQAAEGIVKAVQNAPPGEVPNFKIWQEGENAQSVPTSEQREKIFKQGGVVVNFDTNWAKRGQQTGPLVVIPDDATKEQREAAQQYVREVEQLYKKQFDKSLPGRVITRSENKALQPDRKNFSGGRTATMHLEPGSINDDKFIDYIRSPEGRKELSRIHMNTVGKIPNVVFSEPHDRFDKEKPDVGAVAARDPSITEVGLAQTMLNDVRIAREAARQQQTATPQPQQPNAAPTASVAPPNAAPTAAPQQAPVYSGPQQQSPAAAPVTPAQRDSSVSGATAPSVPQQERSTGSAATTGVTPVSNAPPQPQPTATPVPKEDKSLWQKTKEFFGGGETKKEDQIPKFEDGGAMPVGTADNATLVSDTGQAMARINTNENITFKNGTMDVTPAHRTDPNDLQQRVETQTAQQTEQADAITEQNSVLANMGGMTSPAPQGNMNWENDKHSMTQRSSPENFYESPSSARAFQLATNFSSDPVKHYGGFSTTTRTTG